MSTEGDQRTGNTHFHSKYLHHFWSC